MAFWVLFQPGRQRRIKLLSRSTCRRADVTVINVLDGDSDSQYVPNASYLHSSSPYQAGNAKV